MQIDEGPSSPAYLQSALVANVRGSKHSSVPRRRGMIVIKFGVCVRLQRDIRVGIEKTQPLWSSTKSAMYRPILDITWEIYIRKPRVWREARQLSGLRHVSTAILVAYLNLE